MVVQDRDTAVCGLYAVLVGRLFVEEEGSEEGTLAYLRDLFSGDTPANDERLVDLVVVVQTVAVQRGGDGSGYASDDEKNQRSPRKGLHTVQRVIVVAVLPYLS